MTFYPGLIQSGTLQKEVTVHANQKVGLLGSSGLGSPAWQRFQQAIFGPSDECS